MVKTRAAICVNGGVQPNPFAIVHGFLSAAIETIISEGGFEDPDNDLVGENLA